MLSRNASLIAILLFLFQSPELVVGQDTRTVQRWRTQLRDAAPSYRAQAAYELSKLGELAESSMEDLYDRLGDSDANVRLYSLHALGNIVGRPAETAIRILPLLQDENEHVRYAAEWALARIASLPLDQIADERMLAVFRQAIRQVQTREHHQRHRQVVENAIEGLAMRLEVAKAPSQPSTVERIAIADRASQLNALQQSFELSDTLGQLKIIDQLACFHDQYPAEDIQATRTKILTQVLLRSESLSFHFALQHWEGAGREALMQVFESLPENAILPSWASELVESVEPRNGRDIERLMQIAVQTGNPVYIRIAATDALGQAGRVKSFNRSAIESSLSAMVSSGDEDGDLRCRAIDSLVQLGETNKGMLSCFLNILRNDEEAWSVRMAAAKAIAKAAPEAVDSVDALMEMARAESIEDYQLACVVESLACFQNSANSAAQVWARALRSEDELTRLAGADAVASIGASIKDAREIQELLLGSLMDPEESAMVQVAAARGLAILGTESVVSLSQQLTADNDRANIRAFNALATLGPQASPALTKCIAIIEDDEATLAAKNAAALVVGQMGVHGKSAASALVGLSRANIPKAMRASVVVALAQIGELPHDPKGADGIADDQAIRAAVKFAQYSMGQTGQLGKLVGMLDEQESNYAANALTDIGPAASQSLLKVLLDRQANSQHRLKALEVLLTIPQDNYQPLLASVADLEIGQACAQCISDAFVGGDRKILGDVVIAMREPRQASTVKRLEQIAQALIMDVGAGGEEDAMHVDSALLRSLQQAALPQISEIDRDQLARSNSQSGSMQLEFQEPAGSLPGTDALESANDSDLRSSNSLSLAPNAGQGGQGSPNQLAELNSNRTGPRLEPAWNFPLDGNTDANPQLPIQRLASDVDTSAGQGKRVKVFYGTNRTSSTPGAIHGNSALIHSDARQKLFAVLAAVATIAVCLFGFLRQKLATYAVFAIGGLAVVGWYGLKNNLQNEQAPVAVVDRQQLNLQYGGQLSNQVALGICEVSIPEVHVEGELEAPSIFRLEFTQDSAKHVVLQKTSELENEQFFQQLKGELHQKGKNLLVFVHGYNVSFEDAARRTAQLATDLDFAGAPVFFSWPSQANWYQYQQDKKNIERSVGPIKEFLLELAQHSGAESIDLVAHSMGSVGLTSALAEMDSDQPIFNQVVLAAPDIDAEVFRTRIAPRIKNKSQNTTLYASSTDLALVASRYFNSGKRAGDSNQPIALYPGVDVIDATKVDSSLLGHAYYGGSASVLDDLAELFMNRPAQQRTYLKTASVDGQPYWVFDRTNTAKQFGPSNQVLPTLR